MNYKELSERQNTILSLKEKGYTFKQIGEAVGMTAEIAQANYFYAKQKITTGIPNKDTILNAEQEEQIKDALNALIKYLRELKEIDSESKDDSAIEPKKIVELCKEMAEKVGVPFNEGEFI